MISNYWLTHSLNCSLGSVRLLETNQLTSQLANPSFSLEPHGSDMSQIGIARTGLSRDVATGNSLSGELPVLEEKQFYSPSIHVAPFDRVLVIDPAR